MSLSGALAALLLASDSPDSEVQLSEITVTASKRETRLLDTPVAATVFTQDQIENQRLYNFSDIAARTPGLDFIPYSRQEAYLSIRGTTTNSAAAGADLGVTVFIDDVPTIGVGDNDPDLFDLRSVEVLRGPQGTLFGRNVTGGALVVHTLEPSFTPHESAQLTYGTDNLGEVRSYLTGPLISDTLAGKAMFQYRRQDGILNDVSLGTHASSTHAGGGRLQFLWTPAESVKALFGLDFSRDSSPYKTAQLIGNFQPASFPHLYYSPDDTDQGVGGTGDAKSGGAFARINWDNALGTLTSICGLRDIHDQNFHSTSAEPFNELTQYATQAGRQYTQEMRLASPTEQRLTWVTGLFFLSAIRQYDTEYLVNIAPGVLVNYVPPYSTKKFLSFSHQHVHAYSYAAFGEANYAFSDALKLTLGARLTREEKSGDSAVHDTSGLSDPLIAPHYSHAWGAFTPKATLSYQPLTSLLTYVTASTGFKSGGYDTTGSTVAGLQTPFRPEKVTNYEMGLKWSGLAGQLSLAAAAYYVDYRDLQVNEYNPQLLQFVTANAGRAKFPGTEFEALAQPLPWLTLYGSYAFMGSRYSNYSDGQASYSGNQIPFDARNHYNLGGELHFHTPALHGGELRVGADLTYQSKTYFDDQNDTPDFILRNTRIRGLANTHLTWTSADERLELSAWGKNITNTRYLIVASDLTPFYANPVEYTSKWGNKMFAGDWNARSVFGLSFTYKR